MNYRRRKLLSSNWCRDRTTCEFQYAQRTSELVMELSHGNTTVGRVSLNPDRPASLGNSLAISGIRTGWSSRYARSHFRACLSKLHAFNRLPVSRWKRATIKLWPVCRLNALCREIRISSQRRALYSCRKRWKSQWCIKYNVSASENQTNCRSFIIKSDTFSFLNE